MRVSYPGKSSLLTWHQDRTVAANYSNKRKRKNIRFSSDLKTHQIYVNMCVSVAPERIDIKRVACC
jgi:hypothetical protein